MCARLKVQVRREIGLGAEPSTRVLGSTPLTARLLGHKHYIGSVAGAS
jgi:hypothetical protein